MRKCAGLIDSFVASFDAKRKTEFAAMTQSLKCLLFSLVANWPNLKAFAEPCRAFHQIVDICFREAPLLFCDRLELDNKLGLNTFLCANAYPLNCYPNFYAQIDITTKFDVFNEHGKRHKIRTKAALENFKKKVSTKIFESIYYYNLFVSIFILAATLWQINTVGSIKIASKAYKGIAFARDATAMHAYAYAIVLYNLYFLLNVTRDLITGWSQRYYNNKI